MFEAISEFFLSQFNNLSHQLGLINVIEVLIIAVTIFYTYNKFIKHTQSEKLVRGLIFLIIFWLFGEFLVKINLQILGVFFKTIASIIVLSLVVIFQPEMRRFLGYLGQEGFLHKLFTKNAPMISRKVDVVKELIESIKYFCKTKTGALIVLKKEFSQNTYVEVGTKLDAILSTELLLTIFHTNTPLHDGAVILQGDRIVAAGVLLPLTEDPKLSWKYGTRHRAAIGMSEVSDDACIVVSEETGEVSMAVDGILRKYEDIKSLKEDLEKILMIKKEEDENSAKKNFSAE